MIHWIYTLFLVLLFSSISFFTGEYYQWEHYVKQNRVDQRKVQLDANGPVKVTEIKFNPYNCTYTIRGNLNNGADVAIVDVEFSVVPADYVKPGDKITLGINEKGKIDVTANLNGPVVIR